MLSPAKIALGYCQLFSVTMKQESHATSAVLGHHDNKSPTLSQLLTVTMKTRVPRYVSCWRSPRSFIADVDLQFKSWENSPEFEGKLGGSTDLEHNLWPTAI